MPQFFKSFSLGLSLLFLFSACQQKSEAPVSVFSTENAAPPPPPQGAMDEKAKVAESRAQPFQDATANGDIFSSAAARPGAIDSLKKFVRTAEMRFRVKNAAASTLRIEDIALRNGGFVLNSNLNTEIERRQNTPMSRDSALETTQYSIHSQLLLRVPYRQLDTTLRAIGRLADFLDMRHVNATDISLQLLEKELVRLREGIYQNDLAVSDENKYSPKADRARDSRANSDEAKIESLKMEDQIRYSTVSIDIYEAPQICQTLIANTKNAMPQTPFAIRLGDALQNGAEICALLFLGIVQLWGVILVSVCGYFGWKWLRKRSFLAPKTT